jgi:hypothetical protein
VTSVFLDSFLTRVLLQDYIIWSINDARRASSANRKDMILSNSWAQHLNSLAGNNEANKNMTALTEALAPSTTTSQQLNLLVEEVDTAVLLVGPINSIQRTHSWAKSGGTQSRPQICYTRLLKSGLYIIQISLYITPLMRIMYNF